MKQYCIKGFVLTETVPETNKQTLARTYNTHTLGGEVYLIKPKSGD